RTLAGPGPSPSLSTFLLSLEALGVGRASHRLVRVETHPLVDGRELLDRHVVELAVTLLDLADVHRGDGVVELVPRHGAEHRVLELELRDRRHEVSARDETVALEDPGDEARGHVAACDVRRRDLALETLAVSRVELLDDGALATLGPVADRLEADDLVTEGAERRLVHAAAVHDQVLRLTEAEAEEAAQEVGAGGAARRADERDVRVRCLDL